MKRLLLSAGLVLTGCETSPERLHQKAFVADMHNDVISRAMLGQDVLVKSEIGHTDLHRLQSGGIDLEAFVAWINPYEFLPDGSFIRANKMIDYLEDLEERSAGKISIISTYQDIMENNRKGNVSALIGVEGGHAIENDLEKLEHLYNRGMRYLGITWNNSVEWATSAYDETLHSDSLVYIGLTGFGADVIRTCNELGIMVDISHAGEKTFWDIMDVTTKPVIASHSSVYDLCPHFRNLKDDQLLAIKENGGVIFVNYYSAYLDSTFEERAAEVEVKFKTELDSINKMYGEESDIAYWSSVELMKKDMAEAAPPLDMLIDHIDYIARLIGVDHVGLGSDFDGVSSLPQNLEDCSMTPEITKKLVERGYSHREIRKILGENFKRVFRAMTH